MTLETRADRIYDIINRSPEKRLHVEDIRGKIAAIEGIALHLFPQPTVNATVRGDNKTRVANGKTKRFRHSGDGNEERGYISISNEQKDSYSPTVQSVEPIEVGRSQSPIPYQVMEIEDRLLDQLEIAIAAAIKYEKITGGTRKLPITGEVGEVLSCKQLGLSLLADCQAPGGDAIDCQGRLVQIKTRREAADEAAGNHVRIGRFSEHPFDYALLVILDKQYAIKEIWRADYDSLEPIIRRMPRRNPNMGLFKKAGEKIYDRVQTYAASASNP